MIFGSVIAALIAFLAAALTTGQRLYWLLAYTSGLLVVFSLVSVLSALRGVRCDILGLVPRGNRGESVNAIVKVTMKSFLPVGNVQLNLRLPSPLASSRGIHMTVPPRATREYRFKVDLSHRGVYDVGIESVSISDLFGILVLKRAIGGRLARIEVVPAVRDEETLKIQASDMGSESVRAMDEDAAFPSDIRAWQDGDELKHVHWKLTMRRRELIVRTFEETARPDTLIVPDLSQTDGLPEERLTLEDIICEAALGSAKAQLEAGCPIVLPLLSREPAEFACRAAADMPLLQDAMLKVKFDSPYTYEQVLLQMQGRLQRTGGCVMITARLTSRDADTALRMQHMGVNCKVIWVTDNSRSDAMEMLEKLRMEGVQAEKIDPWLFAGGGAV